MTTEEVFNEFVCDNCTLATVSNSPHHRCRSDIDSCVEGVECPDYIEYCTCKCNEWRT